MIDLEAPTIAQLARAKHQGVCKVRRRLLALHGRDRREAAEAGRPFVPWLYRTTNRMGSPWRVNVSRFRALHPEFFGVPDPEEFDGRLRRLERRVQRLEGRR